jgi:hypothetical protein
MPILPPRRPAGASQASANRNTYIPPSVERAMSQQMQNMPAHLQQQGGGYVPQRTQQAMTQQLQKSLPSHLKQYAGAYVEQRVVSPVSAPQPTASLASRPPTPDRLRQDHSLGFGQQHEASFDTLFESDQSDPNNQSAAPLPSADQPAPAAPGQQPYDFIMNPEKPSRPHLSLPGGSSKPVRAAFIAGSLIIVLILLSVVRGIFSDKPDLTSFISVTQDQQELIHLADNAGKERDLSLTNQNFVATAQPSLSSSQSEILTYLAANNLKMNSKTLNLKVNAQTDTRLTTAAAATTYNQTFQEIVKTQLEVYLKDLDQAYKQTTGPKGRQLLKSDYRQAQLLLKQLDTPAS